MFDTQVVLEDLADIPPGPRLSALSGIDLSRLSGFDCVRVLQARYRQLNHERAALMSAMVEVGLCGPASADQARMNEPDEFAADEIRAALRLTRRAAEAQFSLAYDLITRLPAVHAAMDTGVVDEPRARVLADWTTELSSGYHLPGDRVAAACAHIDALAKAAKRAGDARPIDHIRADLFLGMTDGSYTGLDDATILEHLRASCGDDDSTPPPRRRATPASPATAQLARTQRPLAREANCGRGYRPCSGGMSVPASWPAGDRSTPS